MAAKTKTKHYWAIPLNKYTPPAEDGFGVPPPFPPQDSNFEFLNPPRTDIGITIYPCMTNH